MFSLCLLLFTALIWGGTFRDDFEDGDMEGWQQYLAGGVSEGGWSVSDGILIGQRPTSWEAFLTIGDSSWRNYTMECDAMFTELFPTEWGDIFHYIDIVGRFREDELVYLGLTFRPENGNYDQIQVVEQVFFPGTGMKILPISLVFAAVWSGSKWTHYDQIPYNLELKRWYHMKAVMKEDTFTFYVDDVLVTSFTSSAIPTGGIGFAIGGVVAHLDNVVITGDDIPDTVTTVDPKAKLATTWATMKQGG
jgi:hypothetical protein